MPPTDSRNNDALRSEGSPLERKKFYVECVTLIVLLVYTSITALMYCANKESADAAKSAADTAKSALHISERAYVSVGFPMLDSSKMIATIPWTNSGHIPSGEVGIVIHEVTYVRPPGTPASKIVEFHWKQAKLASIVPGSSMTGRDNPGILITLPGASWKQMMSGDESVVIAGPITYNDGFPEDHTETKNFCFRSAYHVTEKQVVWTTCDPETYIPQMESVDKYPTNEQPD